MQRKLNKDIFICKNKNSTWRGEKGKGIMQKKKKEQQKLMDTDNSLVISRREGWGEVEEGIGE